MHQHLEKKMWSKKFCSTKKFPTGKNICIVLMPLNMCRSVS